MPRSYVRRKHRNYTAQDLGHALDLIQGGETVAVVAESTGIPYRTLMRYKNSNRVVRVVPNYVSQNRVFTQDEESRLKDYLSAIEARRLAFEYAERLGKRMPKQWSQARMAGRD